MSALLDLLYPPKCALCGALGPEPVCGICFSQFERHQSRLYRSLGELDYAESLFDYSGLAARAAQRFKYERVTSLADWMANLMLAGAEERGLLDVDMIVPVPIHWSRECVRGFNQATLLCSKFPPTLVRCDVLWRSRATRPQVGLSHDERGRNLQGAFRSAKLDGSPSILLVDDVLTSGGTAKECASVLKAAGAGQVGILAFAGERRWKV